MNLHGKSPNYPISHPPPLSSSLSHNTIVLVSGSLNSAMESTWLSTRSRLALLSTAAMRLCSGGDPGFVGNHDHVSNAAAAASAASAGAGQRQSTSKVSQRAR